MNWKLFNMRKANILIKNTRKIYLKKFQVFLEKKDLKLFMTFFLCATMCGEHWKPGI